MKQMLNKPKALTLKKRTNTAQNTNKTSYFYLPSVSTFIAYNKCCHRFIGTSGLNLPKQKQKQNPKQQCYLAIVI